MIRQTFGNVLPPARDSHVGDRFYNTKEDKYYIFDNGQWYEAPEDPNGSSLIPTPSIEDAGKSLIVAADGKSYVLSDGTDAKVIHLKVMPGGGLNYTYEQILEEAYKGSMFTTFDAYYHLIPMDYVYTEFAEAPSDPYISVVGSSYTLVTSGADATIEYFITYLTVYPDNTWEGDARILSVAAEIPQ